MLTLPPLTAAWSAVYLLGAALLAIAFRRQIYATRYGDTHPEPDEFVSTERYGETGPAVEPMGLAGPIWTLFVIVLFISMVGRWLTQTTYYNYFLLNLLFWPWFAIILTGAFASMVISPITLEAPARRRHYLLFRLILLAFVAAFVWVSLTWVSDMVTQQVHALQYGPRSASGIIAGKDSVTGKVSVHNVTVDGVKYTIPDHVWWRTLRRGQRIDFVRDPDGSAAFAPGQPPSLTGAGTGVAVSILGLWLVTGGFAIWRLATPVRLER